MKTVLLSLILLAINEAVVKPLIVKLTQLGIKKYIAPAYSKLDTLLMLPDNWQKFADNAEEFIYKSVIPEDVPLVESEKLVRHLVKNFDLTTFLDKAKQGSEPVTTED